jgi:hypothetical protein
MLPHLAVVGAVTVEVVGSLPLVGVHEFEPALIPPQLRDLSFSPLVSRV